MSKRPWFPLYASDWLGSTKITLMSAPEQVGYLRLLCHAWSSDDCTIPDSDEAIIRLAGLHALAAELFNGPLTARSTDVEQAIQRWVQTLRSCFEAQSGKLINSRLQAECAKYGKVVEQRRVAGKASATQRQRPVNGSLNGCSTADPTADQLNQKPETTVKERTHTRSKKRSASVRKAQAPDGFDEFYLLFPRKRSRGDAEKAWVKVNAHDDLAIRADIMAGLRRAIGSADWLARPPEKIPYPATWLRAMGWKDEFTEAQPQNREKTLIEKVREQQGVVQ